MATTADYAATYVRKYGMHLVPLPPRGKRPLSDNWGNECITDHDAARKYYQQHPDANMGAALGPSRLCSLDIDNLEAMRIICAEFGWDIDALAAQVPTIQGKPPGMRLLFRVPEGQTLAYHSLSWPKQDDTAKRFTVFEIRAADTQQRQDVLPPSVHPDTGQPYIWLTKPNGVIPEPPAWLLSLWKNWDALKPQLQGLCPWAPERPTPKPAKTRIPSGNDTTPSVIDAYDQAHSIEAALAQYGYRQQGKRWLSPHSSTGLAGVVIFEDKAWIHHASDPLCSDESGQLVGAFDLYRYYDHGGDMTKAVKAAAAELGMDRKPRPRQPAAAVAIPQSIDPETGEIDARPQLDLVLMPNGTPIMNLDNVVRAIESDPNLRGKIWYDEFLDTIMTTWQGEARQWKDADDVLLQLYMQRHVGLTRIGLQTCHDAAVVAAFHDTRNECKDWLKSLAWDGVRRLSYLMSEGLGAQENAYTDAVGRCWVMSMVARVFRPGCKVDTVPVLEGTQGAGKSTALRILGGKWFTECHENVTHKDFYEVLKGHMLVEIAEMHSFTRAEVERIKGIISCQMDRYRKSYGRNTENHPRQTVLACTTNRDDWQRDETGARRFWPVRCGNVNHDWLQENRDQLFAEAVHLFNDGGSWWDVPMDLQNQEVESRRDSDSWEAVIGGWLWNQNRPTTSEILSDCLKIEIGRHDQIAQKRVGRVMRVLGWRTVVTKSANGRSVRVWIKDE
jgi:predicted P-loop ATPase